MTGTAADSASMRHVVFPGQREIRLGESARPSPGPGEALLQVRRTALCGSDGKLWLKGCEQVPGHEIFGVVDQRGHPRHGRRCLVYIPEHCDHCASCTAGDTHACLAVSSLVGWNRGGGYGEYLTVPDNCLIPVPDDVPDRLAPLLLDTIGTSAHAVRMVEPLVPAHSTHALVCGAGPVGLGAVLFLKSLGYRRVFVSDPQPRRLAFATELGAIPLPPDDMQTRVGLVVESSGSHAARDRALRVVLPRGVVLLIGENDQPWAFTEDRFVRRKDFYIVRTFYFPLGDFAANVELLRRYRSSYEAFVDDEFPLDAFPLAFPRFMAGEMIKPLLRFDP